MTAAPAGHRPSQIPAAVGAAFLALILVIAAPHPAARAAGPTLGAGSDTFAVMTDSVTVVNTALGAPSQLEVTATTSDVRAVVVASAGSVSLTTIGGLTAPLGYPSDFSGSEIAFQGAVADVNAALDSLRFHAPGNGRAVSVDVSVSEVLSGREGVAYNPDNGHYYEFVDTPRTWQSARDTASGLSFNGLDGYLATVTRAAENAFVTTKAGLSEAWLGGSDEVTEGTWKWVAGPEAGQTFWVSGCGSGMQGICTDGSVHGAAMFSHWGAGEPNDLGGEDGLQIVAGGSGLWNDLPEGSTDFLLPSLVEYSTADGAPTDSSSTTRSIAVTVTAPDAPAAPVISSATRLGAHTMEVTATSADDGGSPITDYQYSLDGRPWISAGGVATFTIGGLDPFTAYAVRVRAVNAAGASDSSAAVDVVRAVPDAPMYPQARLAPGATVAQVSWRAPAANSGPITSYRVQAVRSDGVVVRTCYATTTRCTVGGLPRGVPVRFRVAAGNPAGRGPESVFTNYVTLDSSTPGAPLLSLVSRTRTRLTVKVRPGVGTVPTSHTVRAVNGATTRTCTVTGSTGICSLTGLAPGTVYDVSARATNAGGIGLWNRATSLNTLS